MSDFKLGLACVLILGTALGCATDEGHGPKPEGDPDVGLLEAKTDFLSNGFTTIVGEIVPTQKVSDKIDWPDWFHGYTVQLEAGSTMEIEVDASAAGPFRVYGPAVATRPDGSPLFGRAIAADFARLYAGRYTTKFAIEVETSGTYMVVYGPAFVWGADYTIGVRCEAGCRQPDECQGDDECEGAQYCGDNGVRCITAPCIANYDICKPKESDGQYCDRDDMCETGACPIDTCGVTSCSDSSDCQDIEFCGWGEDDLSRICRRFSKVGDPCGGFVAPSGRRQCDPELVCIFPEATFDIPGTCQAP